MKLTLDPRSDRNTISFVVFDNASATKAIRARVRLAKDPLGFDLPQGAVRTSTAGGSPSEGVTVTLRLAPEAFAQAGDYSITVLIASIGKDAAQQTVTAKTVTITRPAASIDVEALKEELIQLDTQSANLEASVPVTLRELGGTADLVDLQISATDVRKKDSKEHAHGVVEVTSVQNLIPAGGSIIIRLSLKGFDRPGEFSTALLVRSPSFNESKVIPIRVSVGDTWGWPLAAILSGVLGGFFVHRVASSYRPRQLNAIEIQRLRARIRQLQQLVTAPQKRATLMDIWDAVRLDEEATWQGEYARATADLAAQRKKLDDFIAAERVQKAKAAESLEQLKQNLERLARGAAGRPELAQAQRTVDAAEALIASDAADEADRKLADAKALIAELEHALVVADLDRVDSELAALDPPDELATQRKAVKDGVDAARKLFAAGNWEEGTAKAKEVRVSLAKLLNEVEKAQGSGGRPLTARTSLTAGLEADAKPSPLIVVREQVSERTTERSITFELSSARDILATDLLEWRWGDGLKTQITGPGPVGHRFTIAGEYRIEVAVSRGQPPAVLQTLSKKIIVLPAETEKIVARLWKRLEMIDTAVLVIALALAAVSGLLHLYVGKPFGSISDYIGAIFWGFGIDSSVRGFSAIFKKITTDS